MTTKKAAEVEEIKPSDFDNEFGDVDFDEEFQEADETKSIPYAQFLTSDVPLTRYAAMPTSDYPYGIFITMTQAEKAGFLPDDNWLIEYPCLGSKIFKFSKNEGTEGYFLKPGAEARIVVLAQSSQEVYRDTTFNGKKAKSCVGNYLTGFDSDGNPQKSEAGIAFDAAPKNTGWQNSIRYLLYFLDGNNEPMSERPFQLRISNAFGIGFKLEMKTSATEMIAASKAHSEMMKVKSVAKAEAAKAAAIAAGDVQGGIDAQSALSAEKRKAIRSLSRKDGSKFVFAFTHAMRMNKDGQGTTFVNGRQQPTIWSDVKPEPFSLDQTKKNGELIYSIGIIPTAYPKLLILAKSDFGKQIEADLTTYEDFKIAPNLRKLAKEVPAAPTATMPDFDPNADDDDGAMYFPEEEPGDYGVTAIEADPAFNKILTTLIRAVSSDQVEKWKVWAMKPTQRNAFIEAFPSYDADLDNLAVRHSATFK